MSQNETAKATIYLDGKQAEAAIDALKTKSKELKVQLEQAKKAGDSITMKKLENEIRATDAASRSLLKDSFDVERVLKNINKVSWRDLEKAQKSVISEMKRMERGTEAFAAKEKNLKKITDELNKTRGAAKGSESMWTTMANGANKYFNMITIGVAALTGIIFSVSQFVKGMVGLDDALADVMKTTGLTRKEVRGMYEDFKYMNTRTPRAELLALAEEAGRLGRTGKRDIMDFVEVANKIKIALGDDLGGNAEEAIREVGKLTEIFQVGNQYGTDFKSSMEKVGSGLNQVANNSNASAEFLIEYMKRMGGIATQAKITAADIMGYASTFDQLGQNVEMAATAQSKVVVDMFTDPGKYAKIAKMEVGAFSQLLKSDANEAFIKFLEGLNGNNEGLSEMAVKLDSLGIDGARATQALASLSSNTKMLREQQIVANDAMEKGISLNNEYAIKNNNLAGSWDKLTTYIRSKFINSGFIGFFEKLVGKTAELIEQPVEAKLRSEQRELNVLVAAITNANATQENRNDLIAELQKNYPDFLLNLNAEKVTNEELQKRLEDVNKQYEDRILLMIKEDMLAKNYRERTELKIKELDLVKQIAEAEKIASEARKKITPGMDANSYRTVLTQEEFNAMSNIPIFTAALEENRKRVDELKKSETDLNNALGELRQNRTDAPAGGSVPVQNPSTPFSPTMDPKDLKKETDKVIVALETAHNARMAYLNNQYEAEKWSKSKFEQEQLDMELVFLVQKKAALTLGAQDTNDIDKQMTNNRLQALQNRNDQMLEKEKSFKKHMDEMDKEFLKSSEENEKTEEAILANSVDAVTDSIKDSTDAITDAKDREKDVLEERARNYEMISNTIVSSLSDIMSGSLDEYATYGDALVLMSLQILKQMAPIWAAQIVGGSLATPDSIMTGGIAGIAKFTAMLAIMEGFISLAESGVKKKIEKKREAATGSKQSGGYSNFGDDNEPDGIYHKNEFIASAPAVRNPTVKPVLDIIDMAQKSGTIQSLNLNAILNNGRQSGGYGSNVSSSSPILVSSPAGGSDSLMGLLLKELKRSNDVMDRLEKKDFSISVEEYERKRKSFEKVTSGGLG